MQQDRIPLLFLITIILLVGTFYLSVRQYQATQELLEIMSPWRARNAISRPMPQPANQQEVSYETREVELKDVHINASGLLVTMNKVTWYTAPDDSSKNPYHTAGSVSLTDGYSASIRDDSATVIITAIFKNPGDHGITLNDPRNPQGPSVRLLLNDRFVAPWFSGAGRLAGSDSKVSYYAFDRLDKNIKKMQLILDGTSEDPKHIIELDFDAKTYKVLK